MSKHVCYINLDGFARYYFDEYLKIASKDSCLRSLMEEGVFFENLVNALPSITNPCQNMILSGSSSNVVKNVYRYYDKKQNLVIQQGRENANETLVDVALKNNLKVVSVAHYLTENKLTTDDPNRLYIYPDETGEKVLARGESHSKDFFSRFEQLNKVITHETIISGGKEIKVLDIPNLLILYADDLDGIGHNEIDRRGYSKAISEEGRMKNILDCLANIDLKLKEFIDICKRENVYDKMIFFITTDHGMTPFGNSSIEEDAPYGKSVLGRLQDSLKRYDASFKLEMVSNELSPDINTTVVGVGMNLNLQLTFLKEKTEDELKKLKEYLLKEEYIESVFTRNELISDMYHVLDTDMIITPSGRYFFSKNKESSYYVRGQHDSTLDSSKKVFGIIFGKGIINKKYIKTAFNYDFGSTMAYCLGIEIPNSNGQILPIFENSNI